MTLEWILWLASILPQPHADRLCLTTTVYLEARSQPFDGQVAVAEVALNRLDSGRYGDNLCGLLLQPRQFAMTLVPQDYALKNPRAWRKAWRAALRAVAEHRSPPDQRTRLALGATHFVALGVASPDWARGQPLTTIGDHSFYRVR
ncbi:MAG: cell wall hydrolase [Xanthomonadales bacterium]|nr:cell wall hydrolase [Xanthomonadales bacterium]